MIDGIPIARTILPRAIAIGFNFDQVGGHFGLCIGNVLTLPSLIIQREFPAASFGLVLGLSTAMGQVAHAVIPIALGAVRDFAHGYRAVFVACMGLQVAVALLMAFGAMTTRPDVLEAARNGSSH